LWDIDVTMTAPTDCTPIIKLVAQAIQRRRTGETTSWETLPSFVRKNYKDEAEEAIRVVKDVLSEPTDAMIDAANRSAPSTTASMIRAAIAASDINVQEE
jgi:hypothetical protein